MINFSCMKQQTAMKEERIEQHFHRANHRLMTSLDEGQRREAIQEFRVLLEEEMHRVRTKRQHGEKVHRKLEEKEKAQQQQKREVQSSLKQRMQMHFKKREVLQLQKLKNYRRVDMHWRDRLKTIASQAREKQKQNALFSNRLEEESLKFWQEKEAKSRVTPNKKSSPRYFSQENTDNYIHGGQTHFLTEANIEICPKVSRLNDVDEVAFPSIRRGSVLRDRQKGGSKSVAIQRPRSEIIKQHLMKSSEFWQQRDGANFQKAMQKLQHIEKSRNKAKQKLCHESQRIKQTRLLREEGQEQRFFSIKQEQKTKSPRHSHAHCSHQPPSHPSPSLQPQQVSRVQKRKSQLFDSQFGSRSRHFELQLRKQQKGGYRKMVREAVHLVKLQAMRRIS